ncbi:MAG: lipid-A-disaccharide synthase [Cyclobacteriaceae bacterium]
MKYYLIAGERSGDMHAANLIKKLIIEDPRSQFRGFGGQKMREAGAEITIDYRELAVMGFVEVVLSLRKILNYLKLCQQDILKYQPNVLILVDYPGFNLRMAKWARKKGLKVFYYISPKIWAWNTGRAKIIKDNVDHMFSILPFEKDFYRQFDFDVDYIGNPVADAVYSFKPDDAFVIKTKLPKDKFIVALLPGSRKQELQNMLPLMLQVCQLFPDFHFVIAAINDMDQHFYQPFAKLENTSIVYEQTYDLLARANAAIVTSGTATLETALFEVPQLVIYRTSWFTYQIGKKLIKIPYISLVNLIANRMVVKELIQNEMTVENIKKELHLIIENKAYRKKMLFSYEQIKNTLGFENTAEKAATLMIDYLKNPN